MTPAEKNLVSALRHGSNGCCDACDCEHNNELYVDAADLIERLDAEIERLEALDRHGRWITRFTGDEYVTFCSLCKEEANEMADYCLEYNYCPNCGCKMDEEEEKIDGRAETMPVLRYGCAP